MKLKMIWINMAIEASDETIVVLSIFVNIVVDVGILGKERE